MLDPSLASPGLAELVTRSLCHYATHLAPPRHAGTEQAPRDNGLAAQYGRHLSAADRHCGSERCLGIGVDAAPPELGREKHVKLVRWLPYCGGVGDRGCLFDELDEPQVRPAGDFPAPIVLRHAAHRNDAQFGSAIALTTSDLAAPRATNRGSLGGCSGRHPPRRAAGKDSFGCCAPLPHEGHATRPGAARGNGHGVGAAEFPPWYETAWSRDSVTHESPAVTSPSSWQGAG